MEHRVGRVCLADVADRAFSPRNSHSATLRRNRPPGKLIPQHLATAQILTFSPTFHLFSVR